MRPHLTARFFVLLSVAQLCGVLSLAIPALLMPYLLTWPVTLLLLWLDYRTLPKETDLTLHVHADNRVDSGQPFLVKVQISSGRVPGGMAHGTLYVPDSERIAFHSASADWSVRANASTVVTLPATAAALGYETWPSLELWAGSVVGLWLRAGARPLSPGALSGLRTRG